METEFDLQIKFLNRSGVFKSMPEKWKNWNRLYHTFIVILIGYMFYMLCHFIVVNHEDVYEVVECLAPAVTCIVTATKYSYILLYSDEVFEMFEEIKELNAKWKDTDHYYFVKEANKLDRLVFQTMFASCVGSTTGYVMIPLIKNLLNYIIWDRPYQYEMPFVSAFHYDITKPFAYVVTYLIQVSTCWYGPILNIIIDTIFFGVCMNICAHFEILQRTIHEMDLKEYVEYHLNIVRLTEKLNNLYSVIIFTEYVLLSLLLCALGFQIVMSNDLIRIFRSIFHGGAAVIDLFIYSYGGQRIMDCAAEICSDFYEIDKRYLAVMSRVKLDLKIESLMYHASLPTFSLIMGRTMSLITMLQSFA